MNEKITNDIACCQKILDQALDILSKQKDLELFKKTLDVMSMINQYVLTPFQRTQTTQLL